MEGRGAQRLISLSDAVVAIAATLLVVPLIELVPKEDVDGIHRVLSDARTNFLAFLVSFVVIYRFWLTHHRIFRDVEVVSGPLAWANGVWLATIVFLPFPTQLVGTQDTKDTLSYGLYIGTMLVATTSAAVAEWLIVRSAPAKERRRRMRRPFVLSASMALALLLVIGIPGIGLWALLVLVPGYVTETILDHRRHPPFTRQP